MDVITLRSPERLDPSRIWQQIAAAYRAAMLVLLPGAEHHLVGRVALVWDPLAPAAVHVTFARSRGRRNPQRAASCA